MTEQTQQKLRDILPEEVHIGNPLDLRDDATAARYLSTLSMLLDSDDYNALLSIYAPKAHSN